MKNLNKALMIEQLDKKLLKFASIESDIIPPRDGWIKAIRSALNISLVQFARILKKSPPTVKELEEREAKKNITLNKLSEVGEALNLRLVYGFVPKDGSLEKMIEKRAYKIAKEIVMRTSHSMKLEDQENTDERLQKAIKDRAEKIKYEMPKYLWD
jgi:predicted DNA-binding mobile mystery protein A